MNSSYLKHSIISKTCTALLLLAASAAAPAQMRQLGSFPGGGWGTIDQPQEHISEEATKALLDTIQSNILMLKAQDKMEDAKADVQVRFAWPTRSAPGRPEFFDHLISNYIDQDPAANSVRDFNCGTRTYDTATPGKGHTGTDISLGPRSFYKQDTEQVIVVAAAAGTIVAKDDTQPDRSCGDLTTLLASTTLKNNVISVRHADGSLGMYFHIKTGSATPKNIGDKVAEGEYLAVVGSAGFSTGPHLHFEVRNAANAVIDPWFGSCNPSTPVSLWKSQEPYYLREIMELIPTASLPNSDSLGTACNNNIAASEPASGYLQPNHYPQAGVTHYFVSFLRDIQKNDQVVLSLKRPDGSVYYTTSGTSSANFVSAYWYVHAAIPASQPSGKWSYEVSYAGKTKSVPFYFNQGVPSITRVYDFYHAGLKHYFRTANAAEAASLTPASGFVATGDDFFALDRAVLLNGVSSVCRFYGSPDPGPNSHFYTADAGECGALKDIQAATAPSSPRWNFEEVAFAAHSPVSGVCPAEAPFPIYRLYNGHAGETVAGKREDSNHRLTSLSSVYNRMLAQGWLGEGVVMCAVSKP